jgi:transcriptional regulator with XRE-family HTH domain
MEDIGDKFRQGLGFHMEKLGLNAKELSLRAGLNDTAIWQLLNEKRTRGRPRLDTALSIANALGVTVDELLNAEVPEGGYGTTTKNTRLTVENIQESAGDVVRYIDEARTQGRLDISPELFSKVIVGVCLLRERRPRIQEEEIVDSVASWIEAHQVGKTK